MDLKEIARHKVGYALTTGALVRPATCSQCDNTKPEAHHVDYSKPLDVIWLCNRCHDKYHVYSKKRAETYTRKAYRQNAWSAITRTIGDFLE